MLKGLPGQVSVDGYVVSSECELESKTDTSELHVRDGNPSDGM